MAMCVSKLRIRHYNINVGKQKARTAHSTQLQLSSQIFSPNEGERMLTHMCSKKIRSDYGYEILRTKELRLYNAKPKYSHLEICLNLLVIQSNRVVFVFGIPLAHQNFEHCSFYIGNDLKRQSRLIQTRKRETAGLRLEIWWTNVTRITGDCRSILAIIFVL